MVSESRENVENVQEEAVESLSKAKWELHDEVYSIRNMYTQVKISANARQLTQSKRALVQMEKLHEGQVRKGKDKVPYIAHPLLIACHALAMGIADDDLLATALLHDVVEDCGVTVDELDVGDRVKEAVQLLTFKRYPQESYHDAKVRYFKALEQNKIAAVVKILDRCNNISHMASGFTKNRMEEYIRETEELVMPLLQYVKHNYPEYYNAAFLLKYHMISVMETLKRLL